MTRLSIGEAIQQVVGVLSTADTAEVLHTIARAARQMMLADEAYLLLREGGRLMLRAANGLPEGLVGRSFVRPGEGIEGWVADHGEPVALSDASRERRFRDIPGRASRVRALAVVPMKLREDVVGVLCTAGMDPLPPVGSRLTGLEILASIGAVTIENDRLLRQERRRARQAEIQLELAGIHDLEFLPFLRRVADAINAALSVDDTQLVLWDEKGSEIVCAGHSPGGRAAWASPSSLQPPPVDMGWAAEILATGQPLLCDDVLLDARLKPLSRGTGMRSLLAVPVQVRGERRGILRVATTQPASFGSEDLAFLTLIAAQVGLSVERTDLSLRQLEVSREHARQQARQQFLGLVSHELKTPVAVIKAYTELLLRKVEMEEHRASDREVLDRMLEQTDRMLAMIEQLLDLQKMETGQFSLEISRFDLAELAKRVAENLQQAARTHQVLLRIDSRVPVEADRRRIEEVLSNLMDNAVKYSAEGTRITVSVGTRIEAQSGKEEALVSVDDRGIGIPTDDLGRIFERSYQGRSVLHRGHVGLGLGLYIAREIVERHGGRVWVESTEGVGSTFHFTLPLTGSTDD